MVAWIQPVEPNAIVAGETYFIALKPVSKVGQWMFWSRLKNGKEQFTRKPGIAVKFIGSEALRNKMLENKKLCCVKVPPNADKRWRAR